MEFEPNSHLEYGGGSKRDSYMHGRSVLSCSLECHSPGDSTLTNDSPIFVDLVKKQTFKLYLFVLIKEWICILNGQSKCIDG